MRQRREASDDLYSISLGPSNQVRPYNGCIVNGVRFHSIDCDNKRCTQNSGIMVPRETNGVESNYFGILVNVLNLEYSHGRRVVLFKCKWFDIDSKKNKVRQDLGFMSINTSHYWYTDHPFIFATQAKQDFYINDNKHGNN